MHERGRRADNTGGRPERCFYQMSFTNVDGELITLEEYLSAAFTVVPRLWSRYRQEALSSSQSLADNAGSSFLKHAATLVRDPVMGGTALRHPFCVLPLDEDRLLVADYGNDRLLVLCANSGRLLNTFVNQASTFDRELYAPLGMAIGSSGPLVAHAAGHLSQLDSQAERIRMLNFFGLGVPESRRLCRPYGIACARTGEIYVSDSGHHRIVVLTPQGRWVSCFGMQGSAVGQLDDPRGIAIEENRLWVADMCNHRLQCFSRGGKSLDTLGRHGDGAGDFRYPVGVAVTCGLLIVSEYVGGRLQVLSTRGQFLQAIRQPFLVRTTSFSCSIGEQNEGSSRLYLYSVAAYEKRVIVADSAGRVHVLAVQRPCSPAIGSHTHQGPATRFGGAQRLPESELQNDERTRKRKRLEETLKRRVHVAIEAADLRRGLAALGVEDVLTLLAGAYADAARHPEHYSIIYYQPKMSRRRDTCS